MISLSSLPAAPDASALDSTAAVEAGRTIPWQQELKEAVRDPRELCRLLELPAQLVPAADAAARDFPLFAPRPYLARIERGNPRDPLLRQILPLDAELRLAAWLYGATQSATKRPEWHPACYRNIKAAARSSRLRLAPCIVAIVFAATFRMATRRAP